MPVNPRLPSALRQELGVRQPKASKPIHKKDTLPRKKRKLYQLHSEADDVPTPQRPVKSILKKRKAEQQILKTEDDILMERDDAEIDYWEAKLGQKQSTIEDELDDGLDDLFHGLDLPRGPSQLEELTNSESDTDSESVTHTRESNRLDQSLPKALDSHVTDGEEIAPHEMSESSTNPRPSIYQPYVAPSDSLRENQKPGAYVPPAKRKLQNAPDNSHLRTQLTGHINRLSLENIATIVKELESMYRTNPRGTMNEELGSFILNAVANESRLLDRNVISHAALIAALYRLRGVDFAASFVQRLVETILGSTASDPSHQCRMNLMRLTAELYNLNVIAATLLYDFIREQLQNLVEGNVEILLLIVKTSGSQLRADDPTALKDILGMLNEQIKSQYTDACKEVPLRMKFMVESLLNLKNNKGVGGEGQLVKDVRTRMRKYIGSLVAASGQTSAEPLRVSLEDIQNVDTRGKWWLVGASWRDQSSSREQLPETSVRTGSVPNEDTQEVELLEKAKALRINNPIRKQIFYSLLKATDYLEAITGLLSLRLKKSQESEISRVLILLVGSEATYNPYYTYIAKGLADRHGMRISLQFCLWDFMRDCGETEVGQIGRSADELETRDVPNARTLINVAKFFGTLVGFGTLPISVLKTLTFSRLARTTRRFLDVLFTETFLSIHASIKRTISRTESKQEFERNVAQVFKSVKSFDASHGSSLATGLDWFLRKIVSKCSNVAMPEHVKIVTAGVEVARIILSES